MRFIFYPLLALLSQSISAYAIEKPAEPYTDPMRMSTVVDTTLSMADTMPNPGLLFLIPVGVLLLFWGLQLLTGILLPKRPPFLAAYNPTTKRWWMEHFSEERAQWNKMKEDKNHRAAMRRSGLIYTCLGLSILGSLIYLGDEPDENVAYNSYGGQKIEWSSDSYYKQAVWRLHYDGTLRNEQDTSMGTWTQRGDKLHLLIQDPSIRKINNLTKKTLTYPRLLVFREKPSSLYLHAYDLSEKIGHTGSQWYEVGRIKVLWNAPTRTTHRKRQLASNAYHN